MSYQPAFEAFQHQSRFLRMARDPRGQRFYTGGDDKKTQPLTLATIALEHAEPYYVAAPICDLLKVAAEGLVNPWNLRREFVPSPQGFMWFARPVSSLDVSEVSKKPKQSVIDGGMRLGLRGFAWTIYRYKGLRDTSNPQVQMATVEPPYEGGGDMQTADGIFIQFFSQIGPGDYMPVGFTMWRYGRSHIDLAKIELAMTGEELPEGEDAQTQRALDFGGQDNAAVAVALQFIHQRILKISPGDALDRVARKQAKRDGWEHTPPLVRTVLLRRTDYQGYTPAEQESQVSWSCQWWTHGHWRNQYYPSLKIHQPRWVGGESGLGFWKGPVDMPVKPPDSMYVVRR